MTRLPQMTNLTDLLDNLRLIIRLILIFSKMQAGKNTAFEFQ